LEADARGVHALGHGQEEYFRLAQQGYRQWKSRQLEQSGEVPQTPPEQEPVELIPPEEQFENLKRTVDVALTAEILERVKVNSWQFFERLVIKLLREMGYGGIGGSGVAFQKGSDEGIDGFINQDKLGLDVVYVQAKRWAGQTVGRPDIQQFVGALAGRQASRGVFITTSKFSQEAKAYVKTLNVRVILIDGDLLAQLMIEHNVGVAMFKAYQLKRLDTDFFNDE
jgi:restriction system protein